MQFCITAKIFDFVNKSLVKMNNESEIFIFRSKCDKVCMFSSNIYL
jgi:hypothetical protein